MKKTLKIVLLLTLCLVCALSACCGGKDDNGSGSDGKTGGKTDGKKHSGYIVSVISDYVALPATSAACAQWHAEKLSTEYDFDKDGKCTAYLKHYTFPDKSLYEDANDLLTSTNWNPIWNDDHSEFVIASKNFDYYKLEDAYEDFDEKFNAYTITYSDKSTQRVEIPSDAEKSKASLETLGVSPEMIVIAPGSNIQLETLYKTQITAYLDCADLSVDKVNQYAKALFAEIKKVADEGNIYDYVDYKTVLEACPELSSEYGSISFMYMYKSIKINVSVSISKDSRITVAVVKSIW